MRKRRRHRRLHRMRITDRRMYRDPSRGRLGGVCAGLADYFNTDTWLVRIIAVTGFLFMPQFFFIGYIVAWIVLPKLSELEEDGRGRRDDEDPIGKEKARQSKFDEALRNQDESEVMHLRRRAFRQCRESLDRIDGRIRRLESYVTSKRYELDREFRNIAP